MKRLVIYMELMIRVEMWVLFIEKEYALPLRGIKA